ncbi:hypothetical protein DFH27DRAFT_656808 [Peziza echinospora]|nr:hypothetical protein DFH27DRAFT_656808 [Peziza echinospora]
MRKTEHPVMCPSYPNQEVQHLLAPPFPASQITSILTLRVTRSNYPTIRRTRHQGVAQNPPAFGHRYGHNPHPTPDTIHQRTTPNDGQTPAKSMAFHYSAPTLATTPIPAGTEYLAVFQRQCRAASKASDEICNEMASIVENDYQWVMETANPAKEMAELGYFTKVKKKNPDEVEMAMIVDIGGGGEYGHRKFMRGKEGGRKQQNAQVAQSVYRFWEYYSRNLISGLITRYCGGDGGTVLDTMYSGH